ncbi:glycosyltransferase family protein [Rathayibacter sp. CAU 1779]
MEYPSGRILTDDTRRLDVSPESFVLTNQFTGSLCIFRRDVLELALPFPRMSTPSEVHDHWIALCASVQAGTVVVDDVVQDYVQHDANVVGEMLADDAPIVPSASWATVRRIADRYEGSHGPRAIARAVFKVSVGWRQLLVETLAQRIGGTDGLSRILALYGRKRRLGPTLRFVRDAERRGLVARRSVIEYVGGWVAGWFVRGRRIALPPAPEGTADRDPS